MPKFYFILGLSSFLIGLAEPASAQMVTEPWTFQPQNRAAIASMMQQVERPAPAAQNNITTLVCGSDGKSAASGNSSCMILNNAAAELNVGQEANGDQTASSSTSTNAVNTTENADDILTALQEK